MNNKELYIWAKKGYGMFNYTTAYRPAVEKLIGDGVEKFGFESDGGEAFKAMFPNKDVFNLADEIKEILPEVSDVKILGDAIVSKWETVEKDLVWQYTEKGAKLLKWFKGRWCAYPYRLQGQRGHQESQYSTRKSLWLERKYRSSYP